MPKLVGLIDVDGHHFPNLCLMKLSAYHKSIGDSVEWYDEDRDMYDIVYMSKVFSDVYSPDIPEPVNTRRVVKGGTGYAIWLEGDKEVYHKDLDPELPAEIESIYPDYSIYPEYTGYGQPLKKADRLRFSYKRLSKRLRILSCRSQRGTLRKKGCRPVSVLERARPHLLI